MRVVIPEFKSDLALFAYLKQNKKDIIKQKCLAPIKSDDFDYGCLSIKANSLEKIGKSVSKAKGEDPTLGPDEVSVDVITNMAGWCDSYMDVLIPDCWDETIKVKGPSGQQLIYHLKNHSYTTDAIIGRDVKMSSKWIDLSQFNINSSIKQGQALIGSSIVKERYDKKCFELYLDDEIKQHSIGLRYLRIYLCVDSTDEDYKEEKSNWDKFYPYVINKEKVDNRHFFFAVTEIKLLEYSAVLFGANELTTVQGISKDEPLESTQKEPSLDTPEPINYKSLADNL